MILRHPVLLLSAGLLLIAVTACSRGGQESRTLDPGRHALNDLAIHTIHLPEESSDELETGQRLASGDVDGDGVDDMVIGVPGSDGLDGKQVDAGQVFVVLGGDLPNEFGALDQSAVTVGGATPGDNLGFAVAIGDLNGDGVADIVASATNSNGIPDVRTDMGEVYILFGGHGLAGEHDLRGGEYDVLIQPAEGFSHLGTSLATGDLNGDDIDDLAVGAPYAGRAEGSPVGSPRTTTGEVYIVFGRGDLEGVISVAENEHDVRLAGGSEFDQFAQSLSIGDMDGDGRADLAVGAPGYDPAPDLEDAGAVFGFTIAGASSGPIVASQADWSITGSSAGGHFGNLVSIPGPGHSGLLAAAPTQGVPDRPGCGVVYGVLDGNSAIDVVATMALLGSSAGEFFAAAAIAFSSGSGDRLGFGSPKSEGGSGAVFIARSVTEAQVDLASPPEDVALIIGKDGEGVGSAITVGDINGDGRVDLVLLSSPISAEPGSVYIVDI